MKKIVFDIAESAEDLLRRGMPFERAPFRATAQTCIESAVRHTPMPDDEVEVGRR